MNKLHATEQGLLIPVAWLVDLPPDMTIRRVQNRLIIETETQAKTTEQLLLMVQNLRKATETLGIPTEEEISQLVDEVRTEYAHHC